MDVLCFSCEGVHSEFIVHNHLLFILCLFYFCKYYAHSSLTRTVCVYQVLLFLFVVIAN